MKNNNPIDQPYFECGPGKAMSLTDAKAEFRRSIVAQRNSRDKRKVALDSSNIQEFALMLDELRGAKKIALYAARANEPQTSMLMRVLDMRSIQVLLPVLGEGLDRGWAAFLSLQDLQVRLPGRPPEPTSPDLGEEIVKECEVILCPALAVDMNGTRLGHGGGWYDRVLKIKRPDTKVFALVFDEEVYDLDHPLPTEEHDVKIDGFISPSGIVRI
ncbi:MAG: 5-formyltetrahydrofolate cyclo-ligase [Candidatus Ancillula sp.]|nr:5-formyltetrahydrofolate cyclo-ligase [Candidatus Ancillula sp.]